MEADAAILPGQAAIIDQPSSLTFQIVDYILVCDLEHGAVWQNGPPMSHQFHVTAAVASQLRQIVAEIQTVCEKLGIARHAGIQRIAHDMDDPGVRQNQADQTDTKEIARQLVDDPNMALREIGQAGKIGAAKPAQGDAV